MSISNDEIPTGPDEGYDGNDLGVADAFSPENIGVIHFIQLGRIYDVLMAILQNLSPEDAEILLKTHFEGSLMGASPRFNGEFVTDSINDTGAE